MLQNNRIRGISFILTSEKIMSNYVVQFRMDLFLYAFLRNGKDFVSEEAFKFYFYGYNNIQLLIGLLYSNHTNR